MDLDKIKKNIEQIQTPLGDPSLLSQVFSFASKSRKLLDAKDGDNLRKVCAEEYNELSKRLDNTEIQESCSVRNVLRTRRLANLLITDKGDLNQSILPKLINHLTTYFYSLGPDRQYDTRRQEQILQVLNLLKNNKELVRLLKTISKPFAHKYADQIIRDTLQIPANTVITDAHARRAALSAWMCYLRQNVGSCFATAPAILVHDEQPHLFLTDLKEILDTGRLKRTYGGIEYAVPLSKSWGSGDLKKPFRMTLHEDKERAIWHSPGFIASLEAAEVISIDLSTVEKITKAKDLVNEVTASYFLNHHYLTTSVEELLKLILLKKFDLTEQDLKEVDNRPSGLAQGSLLMQTHQPGHWSGGKGQASTNYHHFFEKAEMAFKGLADNALLKAWEFTLASFAESKSVFTRWNLYSSLGFGPQEKGGIGHSLWEIIQRKLDETNRKMEDFQIQYEQMYSHVKYLQARVQRASESEAPWLKAEYQSKINEFYTFETLRDKTHYKASRLANIFNVVINCYNELFPRYFQEVYDADMHDVSAGPFDDSPAGFRLLYKHGRDNTSQWTPIRNANDFIDALVNFFVITESELAASREFEGLEEELSELVTAIIQQVKTVEFLETAIYRMAAAHNTPVIKNPLENLDKVQKKPWVYTSGGNMTTLISSYFCYEKPTEISRWVESTQELLVFLVDIMKQNPPKYNEAYLDNLKKGMLMQSPTHAFLFKPGYSSFKVAWENDAFTYTWVRDNLVKPQHDFVENLSLDEPMMAYLIEQFSKKIPVEYIHLFKRLFAYIGVRLSTIEFRDYLIEKMLHEPGLSRYGQTILSSDEIDSMLYKLLPLFSIDTLKEKVETLFADLPEISEEMRRAIPELIDTFPGRSAGNQILSSFDLQQICKSLLCLLLQNTSTRLDYHQFIIQSSRNHGFAMPSPISFADTNWVKYDFAFVVNPGTGKLELWIVDSYGSIGLPMSIWEKWLNGSQKEATWGVFPRAYEYLR